jgi:hypothetical protein
MDKDNKRRLYRVYRVQCCSSLFAKLSVVARALAMRMRDLGTG